MISRDSEYDTSAWRIHAQLVDWTGRVDKKAQFAWSIESAILSIAIAIYGLGGRILEFEPVEFVFFWSGGTLTLLGLLLATFAVVPQLRAVNSRAEWRNGVVYFGHLRFWNPDDLTYRLRHVDIIPILARQVVVMSKIAWRKYRYIQWSFWLGILGLYSIMMAEFLLLMRLT